MQAGQTYYLQAAGFGVSTGAYTLSIRPYQDDFGNTLDTAYALPLSPAGDSSITGKIEVACDVDMFQFTAPFDGQLAVSQAAASSDLDPTLTVFAHDGTQLSSANDNGAAAAAETVIAVQQGQTYYVQAGSFNATTGAFTLTCKRYQDDHGNDPADASVVPLSPAGNAVLAGSIGVPSNVDVFKFTARVTGQMLLRESPAPGSTL